MHSHNPELSLLMEGWFDFGSRVSWRRGMLQPPEVTLQIAKLSRGFSGDSGGLFLKMAPETIAFPCKHDR